jgi:hypothetical protein
MYSKTALTTLRALLRGRNSNGDDEYLCSVTDKRKQNDDVVAIVLRFTSYSTATLTETSWKLFIGFANYIIFHTVQIKIYFLLFRRSSPGLNEIILQRWNDRWIYFRCTCPTLKLYAYLSTDRIINSFVDFVCKLVILKSYKLNDQWSTAEWWRI